MAVIFAANQNDVVGWVVAVIAAFWLALAAFVVFSIQRAAKKAGAKLNEAQNAFNSAAGRAPSPGSPPTTAEPGWSPNAATPTKSAT